MTPNKETNWITIEEDQVKKPAASAMREEPVKHKVFWGVGFVVLVFAAFAVLAPSQFRALLQGNLFDTTGIPAEEVGQPLSPLTLLPQPTDSETAEPEAGDVLLGDPVEETGEPSAEPVADTEAIELDGTTEPSSAPVSEPAEESQPVAVSEPIIESDPVVQPQGDAVEIAVEPIATAESIDIAPLAEESEALSAEDIVLRGSADEIEAEPVLAAEGSEEQIKDDLIRDLQQQIEQLQQDQSAQNQLAQGISGVNQLVQDQIQLGLNLARGTAPTGGIAPFGTAGVPTGAIPTGVATTTAFGQQPVATAQGSTVQPGFRVNPYAVTISPQQVLQQNLATNGQFAQQLAANAGGQFQPAPQFAQQGIPFADFQQARAAEAALGSVNRTPDSGPADTLLLTLILTFMGWLGWKAVRAFARV